MTPHYRGAHAAAKVQRRVHPLRRRRRAARRCVRLAARGGVDATCAWPRRCCVTFDERVKAIVARAASRSARRGSW